VKYFGQYFHYFPLQAQRQNPFTGQIRPRLDFASGVRLGLAWGLGSTVPRPERFFAGGSATLRGFEQNTVGPITPERFALGGEALLVLNNELRTWLLLRGDYGVVLDPRPGEQRGQFYISVGPAF
jgi:outer membrane protein assembly factor BamA